MNDPGNTNSADARRVWLMINDLVLDNQRRRQVTDALGISFGKSRALRRLAGRPMTMSELAAALDVDPPNASVLVNALEGQGLVRRGPHPDDRRAKLVEATSEGKRLAADADRILGTPPPSLEGLPAADIAELDRILNGLEAPGD